MFLEASRSWRCFQKALGRLEDKEGEPLIKEMAKGAARRAVRGGGRVARSEGVERKKRVGQETSAGVTGDYKRKRDTD